MPRSAKARKRPSHKKSLKPVAVDVDGGATAVADTIVALDGPEISPKSTKSGGILSDSPSIQAQDVTIDDDDDAKPRTNSSSSAQTEDGAASKQLLFELDSTVPSASTSCGRLLLSILNILTNRHAYKPLKPSHAAGAILACLLLLLVALLLFLGILASGKPILRW